MIVLCKIGEMYHVGTIDLDISIEPCLLGKEGFTSLDDAIEYYRHKSSAKTVNDESVHNILSQRLMILSMIMNSEKTGLSLNNIYGARLDKSEAYKMADSLREKAIDMGWVVKDDKHTVTFYHRPFASEGGGKISLL